MLRHPHRSFFLLQFCRCLVLSAQKSDINVTISVMVTVENVYSMIAVTDDDLDDFKYLNDFNIFF